jgi:GT2 family glycosyltransferase/MoaA/NifB/PqqE/SkfB family radical SAM enzyme
MYEPDADLLTEPLPSQIWIELTSKCPFRCVFCSRQLLRGEGRHMDFDLYRRSLEQLASPEVIRLNYAGESIHYPRLAEAVALAKAAGARTELVTAFATIAPEVLEALVSSGLDRLTVSLHTLEPRQFQEIYGLGSLDQLQARIGEFRRLAGANSPAPELDFAFVAMERNLGQLEPLAAYAAALGVREILVCPVIRRDPIPEAFRAELESEHRLTESFRTRLRREIERVRGRHPEVRITQGNPEVEGCGGLGEIPSRCPDRLPVGARIRSCDQNPWNTAHVLADGDVVACEVHDRRPLGNLSRQSWREVWWGEGYRKFRQEYSNGLISECNRCPWKTAYYPAPPRSFLHGGQGADAKLLAGWHPGPDPGLVWSRQESAVVLARPPGARRLRVRGILPPRCGPLEIIINGTPAGQVEHPGDGLFEFARWWQAADPAPDPWLVRFRTRRTCCPAQEGWNGDARRLGFALMEAAAEAPAAGPRKPLASLWVLPAFALLALADAVCRRLRNWAPRRRPPPQPYGPGVSVVIPERDNPALLARCLAGLEAATRRLGESCEVIVVVNGTPPERYAALRESHREVRWLWFPRPLGFSAAIRAGLRLAAYDWVYLLNNDMVLDPDALEKLMPLRAPDVFAIASQIVPERLGERREETNWTDWRFPGGVVEIYDAPPREERGAYPSLYAGGGSSLFRRCLLEKLAARAGHAYEPFYWEDVEWGVVARKLGYRVLFCPASKALHTRRATIARHYAPEEVERIFRRNGYRFQLRNVTAAGSLAALGRRILEADRRTQAELLRPGALLRAAAARLRSHFFPLDDSDLNGVRHGADRCTIAP